MFEPAHDPRLAFLFQGYLENTLTAEECLELRDRLREEPGLAATILDDLRMGALLKEVIAEEIENLESPTVLAGPKSILQFPRWIIWACAACAGILAGGYFILHGLTPAQIATLRTTQNGVILERSGRDVPFDKTASLIAGDTVRVEGSGEATILYKDSTQLRVVGNSRLSMRPEKQGKCVLLEQGGLTAEVMKQPQGRPMVFQTPNATATVLGTRLRLSVDAKSTRLEVSHGEVKLTRTADGASVSVPSGTYAVAGAGTLVAVASDPNPSANTGARPQVQSNEATPEWPGPKNTGYRSETRLHDTLGRTIREDHAVIEGEKIAGGLVINAKDVIVRNCWIISNFGHGNSANATGVIGVEAGASVTIENCTLDGGNATHAGVWNEGSSLVVRSCNIFGVNDGVFCWDADNFIVEDNYLHDFTAATSNGAIDGFQTTGGSHGVIRHNVFDIKQDQTSGIMILNGRRNSDDILVDNNLFAGSGVPITVSDVDPSEENPDGGHSVTNIRFTNNKFSTRHYPKVGRWGIWYTGGAPTDGWHRSGNVVLESGQNVDKGDP